MAPSVERVRTATPEEWDEVWRDCAHATYFQSREWAEVWAASTRGRFTPDARYVHFDDGRAALLPLSTERRLAGLRTVVSSIAGTYGGWLSRDGLSREHARALCRYLTGEFRDLFWKLNPFDESTRELSLPPTEPDDTQVLDLAPGFERLEHDWSKGHRAAAKQAFRAGVEIRLADTEADWRAYFRIYEDSLRRWGASTLVRHPWSLFEELRRRESPHVRLWLAEHEAEPVAGALCFHARRHAVYWHGAVLERALPARPVHALIHAAVRHACEEPELRWFDFNPSGPLAGVRAFKKGFGTLTLPCPNVRIQPNWLRLARKVHGWLGG